MIFRNLLLLSISPDSGHGLVIIGRIPVRIKHNKAIGSNQIQTTPTSFTAKHKDELWTLQVWGEREGEGEWRERERERGRVGREREREREQA